MGKTVSNRTEKVVYHSHRPFLVVELQRRPASGTKTSIKGWGEASTAWEVFENPYVVDRLKTTHLCAGSAILDLLAGTVVKNRFAETAGADIYAHYVKKYADKINEAVAIWHRREGHGEPPTPASLAGAPAHAPQMPSLAPPLTTPLHGGITVTI